MFYPFTLSVLNNTSVSSIFEGEILFHLQYEGSVYWS